MEDGMTARVDFQAWFTNATRHAEPRDWQLSLGMEAVCRNRLLHIPTGLGKTDGVLAAWLYHRVGRDDDRWPRRLVWCLPMRVLVEQTEQVARTIVEHISEETRPDVYVAMGGKDAGEWFLHPEKPSILIGTQDMLLSRALNRGYASGRARWPMEYALLNQDCLWVMDEVQLMDVGLATSAQLQAFRDQDRSKQLRPCHTWWMSATLQAEWLRSVDTAETYDEWIKAPCVVPPEARRGDLWEISKSVTADAIDADDSAAFASRIASEHDALAETKFGRITLVVCNTVERACATHTALQSSGRTEGLELVHGRFRPAERAAWRERFLSRSACASGVDRIIVATQVVEAGVDISAGCLITELAPWPGLVQRFGRYTHYDAADGVVVNRGRDEKAFGHLEAELESCCMTEVEFKPRFKELTGNEPLRWQERLFHEHFAPHKLPNVIDLPTGLGKTMVMAIWLIAREINKDLPRRLIYVVDRRTVVDQATDVAHILRDSVGASQLAVSTLRGQLADNREWSRDPSRPAIIIGTVDLIGSALLFSGYRSSYKRRPLEAGLLGQDSLLVLDEAHLSKPFEKLVTSITQFQHDQGTPMQVVRMSATSGDSNADKAFHLDTDPNSSTCDLKPDPHPRTGNERNQIIARFNAAKRLAIEPPGEKKDLNKTFYEHATDLANNDSLTGKRIVVFVRSPADATKIAALIRNHEIRSEDTTGRKPKTITSTPYADTVEILTGTMRGLERDKLIERPVLKRFLDGDIDPADAANHQPVFLISTSAGEVGFDLNADHMVCDAAPLDSMIQRLGRVNRRGKGDATVRLVPEALKTTDKDGKFRKLTPFQLAIKTTIDLMSDLIARNKPDVSPRAIAEMKANLWRDGLPQFLQLGVLAIDGDGYVEHRKERAAEVLKSASTPDPTMVELTDILLDAWSMTGITQRMPGRPEVAPWLRGIADDLPQTTLAWRAELDLFIDDPNPGKSFKSIFAKHRIRAHESLTTNSYRVVEFFKEITKKNNRPDLLDTRVIVKLSRELIVTTIEKLLKDNGILNADPTLILPATFGGLDEGILSHKTIAPVPKPDDPPPKSLDVADAPGYEPRKDASARLRILIERTDEGWKAVPLPGGVQIPVELNPGSLYDSSTLLFKAIANTDLRVRLVRPVAFDEEGVPVRSLVILSPVGDKAKKEDQLLTEHVGAVESEALRIANDLGLKDPVRAAVLSAARWHDEGKKADIWQRFIGRPDKNDPPLGKAATTRDGKSLRGYRHEFGSLLRIHHPDRHATDCSLPPDPETRDLALHLIATHHGFGRPQFDNPSDRDFQTRQSDAIHTDAIRRFAWLQRKYGWWQLAWLENLLRCADALASADPDADDDDANESHDEVGGVK